MKQLKNGPGDRADIGTKVMVRCRSQSGDLSYSRLRVRRKARLRTASVPQARRDHSAKEMAPAWGDRSHADGEGAGDYGGFSPSASRMTVTSGEGSDPTSPLHSSEHPAARSDRPRQSLARSGQCWGSDR